LPDGVEEIFLQVKNAPKTSTLKNAKGHVQLTSPDQLWRESYWQPVEKPSGWMAGLELCQAVLTDNSHRQAFDRLTQRQFAVVVVSWRKKLLYLKNICNF
jgi:hypothetical protein